MEKRSEANAELVSAMPYFSGESGRDVNKCPGSPVRLYLHNGNICENESAGRCDDSGHYYGIGESDGGSGAKFCPRHWYEMHYAPDAEVRLVNMTETEYREALEVVFRERAEAIGRVAKQLSEIGDQLTLKGFSEEAGSLYEMSGRLKARRSLLLRMND